MRLNTQELCKLRCSDYSVIILSGPTAVGKTEIISSLFCDGFEVINADSIQVYKGLNIGSAKPDRELLCRIPHHLVDIIPPYGAWSVMDFINEADKLIPEIKSRGNMPLISGGNAFYIKEYLYGLSSAPKADEVTRKQVADMIKRIGLRKAHEELMKLDAVSAARIHENDSYRISRALEVCYSSGKPLSSFRVSKKYRSGIKPLVIHLTRDKLELRERIKTRVRKMFETGLREEVDNLILQGAGLHWQSMQAIGYKEFFTDTDDVEQQIVIDTIHYAKRQETFFNSFENLNVVNLSS